MYGRFSIHLFVVVYICKSMQMKVGGATKKRLLCILSSLVLGLCAVNPGYAGSMADAGKAVIKVIDSLKIDLSRMDSTICIDDKVVVSFANDSVFACKWYDGTGNLISEDKVITLSPRQTETYRVELYYFTGELIEGGDFESGKNFYTAYHEGFRKSQPIKWLDPPLSYTPELWDPGKYKIGKCPRDYHPLFSTIRDHTTGAGNMLMINGSTEGDKIAWRTTVTNIKAGKTYAFSAWGSAIGRENPAKFHFTINGKTLGEDHSLKNIEELSEGCWEQIYELWVADRNKAEIALVNLQTQGNGNDFALDDISFAAMEKKDGEITVKVLPKVKLDKLENMEKCEGEMIKVDAEATGSGALIYRWTKDGNLLAETGSLLTISEAALADTGEYICSVSGECGTRPEKFRIDVRKRLEIGEVRDTVRPCDRDSVALKAEATGYQLKYTWAKPSQSEGWKGESSAEYVNRESHWNRDTGTYTCRITSRCGTAIIYRVFEAGEKIRITGWPEDLQVCERTNVRFEVGTNIPPQSAVWTGGRLAQKVKGEVLELKEVGQGDRGVYHCVVEDQCGEVYDSTVILGVVPVLSKIDISRDTAVCLNGRAVFKASADGVKPHFMWTLPDGSTISGEELIIDPVTQKDTGTYYVVVTDSCGNQLNKKVSLSLLDEYKDLEITSSQEVCPGGEVVMEVTGGKPGMAYIWTTPEGMVYTGPEIRFNAQQPGNYQCRVKGTCEPVDKICILRLKKALHAWTDKTYFLECPGENIRLRVDAEGTNVQAEWWKAGKKLGEGPEWLLTALTPGDEGVYECRVSSDCGSSLLYDTVKLREPLEVVDSLVRKYVRPGEDYSLFANVNGDSHRIYSWWKDGQPVAGADGNRLKLKAPLKDTTLVYTARVLACNTVEVKFEVIVTSYQTIEENTTVGLCEGGDYWFKVKEKPEGWCEEEYRMCWVAPTGDTISFGPAFGFQNFIPLQQGEYVYYLWSACGNEIFHLYVEAIENPVIEEIYCGQYPVKEDRLAVCKGEDIMLEARVKGAGLLTYEWSKDGKVLPEQRESFLLLGNVAASTGGEYTCRVVSAACGESSRKITIEVHDQLKVEKSPDVTACPSQEVTLTVKTNSVLPLEFIWGGPQRWMAHSDGFNTTYSNASVDAGSEGVYYCRVKGLCGSDSVSMQVNVEKEIVMEGLTAEDSVCSGARVYLEIPGEQEGLKYSWTLPDKRVMGQQSIEIAHFAASDTGSYHYHAETRNGCFTFDGVHRLVLRPALSEPVITPDTAVCEGKSIRLSAYSEGKDVEYEWRGPHGLLIDGPYVDINPVRAADTGLYEVVVTDICNVGGKRGKVTLSLLEEFKDVVISEANGVCEGKDVVLSVKGGNPGLTYEWRHHGRVVGQEACFELKKAVDSEAGVYICRITGKCGFTEREAKVEVYPWIRAEKLEADAVCVRENSALAVKAIGKEVTYKWLKEEDEVGYRTAVLELPDVIPADAGRYVCQVNSHCGDTTLSFDFRLKENTQILRHSADRILCEDDGYHLTVEAKGENNSYHWFLNGQPLEGEGNVIERPALGYADTLKYTCIVEGDCGRDTASMFVVVGEFRKLRRDMADTLCEASNYKYNVTAIPPGTFEGQGFNYKWTFNGNILQEGRSSLFSLTEITPQQAGDYYCEITTLPGAPNANSLVVKLNLEVITIPRIESISPDLYIVEGSEDSLKVVASGDELAYTWTKDGVLTGNTSPVTGFHPVSLSDRGRYKVVVSNRCSKATGSAEVEVWHKTVIVYPQERDDRVCLNNSVSLGVEAWGEGLLYRWYLNGELLDVPFQQPLIIGQVDYQDEGQYLCVVSGRGGLDSCRINLFVMDLPEVGILGWHPLCPEEAESVQVYTVRSNENRLEYHWEVEGGKMVNGDNWKEAEVKWEPDTNGKLVLEVTSLGTRCTAKDSVEMFYYPQPEVNIVLPDLVGYCRDTLPLDRAYPWGGEFFVNEMPSEVIRFADKTIPYKVEYFYVDENTRCHAVGRDTVRIAAKPSIRLSADTITTGWCAPVYIEVLQHSPGNIHWEGHPLTDGTDVRRVMFRADQWSEEVYPFYAMLTDEYDCTAMDTAVVVLLPSPQVSLPADTVIGSCNGLIIAGKCNAETLGKVVWEPAEELNVLDGLQAEMLQAEPGVHLYVLSVSDQYGCMGQDSVKVEVVGAPELRGDEICIGDSVVVDAGNYSRFSWDDAYAMTYRVIREPGAYRLTVEDRFRCMGEAAYLVHDLPRLYMNDTLIYEGQEAEFRIDLRGEHAPYDVRWQDGSTADSYVATTEGRYEVTVWDNIGCMATDTAFLTVKKWYIAAPNAFLPASHGENSRFYLKEVNFGSRFEMYIYDRWGELLYKTNEIGFKGGWDGTFKGIHCQPGAYVWVAFVDGKEVAKGTLVLVK